MPYVFDIAYRITFFRFCPTNNNNNSFNQNIIVSIKVLKFSQNFFFFRVKKITM